MPTITIDLDDTFQEIEKQVILAVLAYKNDNRTHTYHSLDIGERTLQRKLKRWRVPARANKNSHTLPRDSAVGSERTGDHD